jgi:hypothetical protein
MNYAVRMRVIQHDPFAGKGKRSRGPGRHTHPPR